MDHINIRDKKYSLETLELLIGQKGPDIKSIPDSILVIAEAVDDPKKLPYLIETIKSIEIDDMERFRFVLFRVQIDSQLRMNEDLMKYQKRLFVSQIIEKLLYEEIFFEMGKEKEDEEEE